MQLRGIHYDAGTDTVTGGLTRASVTKADAAREMEMISQQLHANAVRITGRDAGRLAMVGELAAERGLDVWLSPLLVNGDASSTLALIADTAEAAERIRQLGHTVVLVVGCELSAFLAGVIPGDDVVERLELISDPTRLIPAVMASGVDPRERMAAFLAEAVALAQSRFHGPVTYASGTWEDVDWELFDIVGVDAYRSAANRETYAKELQKYTHYGRPVAVTEFGSATFHGARDLGSLAWMVVDRSVAPGRLPPGIVRDEPGQAAELAETLDLLETAGVSGGFVYTFIAPSYPANDQDPRLDLDAASYGLMRSWADGHVQPKQSFHAVASHFARAAA